MMLHIVYIILCLKIICVCGNDFGNRCENKWQGLLTLIPEEKHPTIGCKITAILDSSHLTMYKGGDKFGEIALADIKAPIHVVPNSVECLVIHHGRNTMLCSPNEYSRDSWWIAITQQLLCLRLGKMRNEIAGETSLEEEQELEFEHVLTNKNQKGVNIHIDDDVKNLPKIHYKNQKEEDIKKVDDEGVDLEEESDEKESNHNEEEEEGNHEEETDDEKGVDNS